MDHNNKPVPFNWALGAPYLETAAHPWISDFVMSDRHVFQKIPHGGTNVSWHQKKSAHTSFGEWRAFTRTAAELVRWADDHDGGVITVFPQLAASVATKKRIRRLDLPLVCWFFNTNLSNPVRTALARATMSAVDRFVVPSTVEIEAYAEYLELPTDRFTFVPIQYGGKIQTDAEDNADPFVFATGSGFRDYGTFFEAMGKLGLPAKVVAGPRVLAGLHPPANVEILDGVNRSEIHRLVRQARVNVIPMHTNGLTAGIVTMAETMRHGRAVVATDRSGIDDYLTHDDNALLVPPHDPDALAASIGEVFENADLRARLNAGAAAAGEERHTDQAGAAALLRILDDVVGT